MNRLSSRCSSNVKRVVLASIVTKMLTGTAAAAHAQSSTFTPPHRHPRGIANLGCGSAHSSDPEGHPMDNSSV